MASPATLDGLPVEVVEAIISRLELHDICCLREAGREIATKASQGSFKAHFISKRVELSEGKLHDFVRVTQHDGLGCLLQNLTLVAHVPLTEKLFGPSNQEQELKLLITALANVCTKSAHGSLRSLTLALEGALGGGTFSKPARSAKWTVIWQVAERLAQLVASAIHSASVPVDALDLFGTTERCALSSHRVLTVLETFDISRITSLSMIVSAEMEPNIQDEGAGIIGNLGGILRVMPLEELQLHWYQIPAVEGVPAVEDSKERLQERQFLDEVTKSRLPSLTSVTFKGLHTSETTLATFLSKNTQLRRVSLEWIHLEGRFGPVFEVIHRRLELEYLYLDDLFEAKMIHFPEAKGERHFPTLGKSGPTWIERTGSEAQALIKYDPKGGRPGGSPQTNRWFYRRRLQFGPY